MKAFYNEKFPDGDASIEEQLQKVKDVEFTGGDAKKVDEEKKIDELKTKMSGL